MKTKELSIRESLHKLGAYTSKNLNCPEGENPAGVLATRHQTGRPS